MKSGERAESRAHHNKRVRMQRGTDHTANNVASCSKPFKTQGHCLRERQRGSRAFLRGNKQQTHTNTVEPKENRQSPETEEEMPAGKREKVPRKSDAWHSGGRAKQAALS